MDKLWLETFVLQKFDEGKLWNYHKPLLFNQASVMVNIDEFCREDHCATYAELNLYLTESVFSVSADFRRLILISLFWEDFCNYAGNR